MPSFVEIVEQLSNASGTPGREEEVREVIKQHLAGLADFSHDRLGSLVCSLAGGLEAPRIMLAGHMDEVGFIVRYVTPDGFLKFHPLGGWWEHTLLAQQVIVLTGKGGVAGVVGSTPVHHLRESERKTVLDISNMFIDVGAGDKREAQEKFGIMPGDHIVPRTVFAKLGQSRCVSGKAFDDRVGVALFVEALKTLSLRKHPNKVFGVGTVQEEVGTRGAETAVELVKPDVAIVLEGPPADDFPGTKSEEAQAVLGKGPQIRVFDPSMIANRKLVDFVLETAAACSLPYQIAVRISGATDARPIHLHNIGIPAIVLGVPVRYAHSHVGVISLDDFEHTLQLLVELLTRLDAGTVAAFTAY